MKAALIGVVTIALLAGVVWSRAQTPADRPPGVDPDRWIPITNTVGIVVTSTSGVPLAVGNLPRPSDFPFGRATGRLMARHNGQWLAFDVLGSTEARVQPAL